MVTALIWKYPYSLYSTIPLIILIIFLLWYYYRKRARFMACLGVPSGGFSPWSYVSPKRFLLTSTLLIISLFFLSIVLMRPYAKAGMQESSIRAGDLVIALDISRSMLAQDVLPNRLEVAKQKIRELVSQLGTHRVSLIVFSGSAFVQIPLTRDKQAFFSFLDAVDVETISSGTTNIVAALEVAQQVFNTVDTNTQILFLVTDGEDFVADSAHLLDRLAHEPLTIITYGVGTEKGAPIPVYDNQGNTVGYQKDKNNSIVITAKNSSFLRQLAAQSQGMYVESTKDTADIAQVVQQLHNTLQLRDTVEHEAHIDEKYHLFLLIAMIGLWIIWML